MISPSTRYFVKSGLVVCELLNTVSLLKSENTNDKIKHKKLKRTKINCKKVKDIIFVSKYSEIWKFFIEKKIIIKPTHSPKLKNNDQ